MRWFYTKYRPLNIREFIILVSLYTLVGIVMFFACMWALEASGSDKAVSEGYYGSERFELSEQPVRPNSDVIVQKGWIGDRRVNIRTLKESGKVTGWIGGERVRIKEKSWNNPNTHLPSETRSSKQD